MHTRADRLAAAVRDHPLVIEERSGHRCDAGAHSYLADGRVVCWVLPTLQQPHDPAVGHAVDAELEHQPMPSRVLARWGGADSGESRRFWERWCATEVLAKLAEIPMVVLARQSPVTTSPVSRSGIEVHWIVRRLDDVVGGARGLSGPPTTSVT